jgi:phosphatidylserine/phosphatidylglycerophosphate/cardiolipin synthase-like enzyme
VEFERIVSAPDEQPGNEPDAGCQLAAFRVPSSRVDLPPGVRGLIVIPEMREIRAQVSFSRLDSISSNLQGEFDSNPTAYGDEAVRAIMEQVWPFGDPRPRVYYDARALTPRPRFNMHAKCVIMDVECALITSANFTRRAQEQNTECGVLLEAPTFAQHLARQWLGLIDAGLVMEAS